jgi:hypothetical protein
MRTGLLALLAAAQGVHAQTGVELLAAARWTQRVLLVFADQASFDPVQRFEAELAGASCEVQARALTVGWIFEQGSSRFGNQELAAETADSIRGRFAIAVGSVTVLLIGKDGGVKARYGDFPALREIFALIDGMPMRRAEMQTQGAGRCD